MTSKKATSRKTGEDLANRIEYCKARYIEYPVYKSIAFMAELGSDPRKSIDTLTDDSREWFADLRKDARRKMDGYLKGGRKLYRRARKNPRKTFDSVVKDSRNFWDDFGSEAKERLEGLVEDGRELAERLDKDSRRVTERLRASGKKALENFSG